MSKDAVNQRFVNCINYLISEKEHLNKTTIATKLNISKSKFSEILNGRMNVGIEEILNVSTIFDISMDYLMFGKGNIERKESLVNEEPENYGLVGIDENSKNILSSISEKVDFLYKEVSEKIDFIYKFAEEEVVRKEFKSLEQTIKDKKDQKNGKGK